MLGPHSTEDEINAQVQEWVLDVLEFTEKLAGPAFLVPPVLAWALGLAIGADHAVGGRLSTVDEDVDVLVKRIRAAIKMSYNPS